jgi:hypothetical protein
MANHLYRVRYDRKTRKESKVKTNVYSEGEFREFDLVASSEEEAIEIADRVHARQFADASIDGAEPVERNEGDVVVALGEEVPVDPINAHTNYKLQGVEVLRRNV